MSHKQIIQDYIEGWKEKNPEKILNTLHENCTIIESHGPKYQGKEKISKWIENWTSENKVESWEITSFNETQDAVFIEWTFECTVKDKKHLIEGASIIKFTDDKINYIREYKTSRKLFDYK